MFVKQLSVFIENREGRLEEVLKELKEAEINIISLSLADTADFGLLRLLVSEPERGKKILSENGFSAMLTEVIAVKFAHKVGTLCDFLTPLCEEHINIEYMYGLSTGDERASMVIKTTDNKKAEEIIETLEGVEFITAGELERLSGK